MCRERSQFRYIAFAFVPCETWLSVYEIILLQCLTKEVCTQFRMTNRAAKLITAGCLRAGEDESASCHSNSSVSHSAQEQVQSKCTLQIYYCRWCIDWLIDGAVRQAAGNIYLDHANLIPDSPVSSLSWHFNFSLSCYFYAKADFFHEWVSVDKAESKSINKRQFRLYNDSFFSSLQWIFAPDTLYLTACKYRFEI